MVERAPDFSDCFLTLLLKEQRSGRARGCDVSDSRLWEGFLAMIKEEDIAILAQKLIEHARANGISFFIYEQEKLDLSSKNIADAILGIIKIEKKKLSSRQARERMRINFSAGEEPRTGREIRARVGTIIDVTV